MTERAACRVLVADSAPTRLGVRMALEGVADVCAEAANREDAVQAARRVRPDVCLVGQLLPGGGIETVRKLSEAVPDAAVVLLACTDHADDLVAALRAGALGYVPADVNAARLRRVVRPAHEAPVPQLMVRDLVDERGPRGPAQTRPMTRCGIQILRCQLATPPPGSPRIWRSPR